MPPFVETDAEVIERGAVCIETFTVRPYTAATQARGRRSDGALLSFPDLSFCAPLLADNADRPHKSEAAPCILKCLGEGEDVLDCSVREADDTMLDVASVLDARSMTCCTSA